MLSIAVLRHFHRSPDYSRVPLAQCEYLSDVVEPVSFVEGISIDDGGSIGLVFTDSTGKTKSFCLLHNLEGQRNLIIGTSSSDTRSKGIVPIAGADEKALLGLLERWYRSDPDARLWEIRIENWMTSDRLHSVSDSRKDNVRQIAKGMAVAVLKTLRERN
jgi:hypothetical protein